MIDTVRDFILYLKLCNRTPALISGIWGMNTGGLPGKESHFGFFMVVAVAVLLAIIVGIHIKRKDFSK
ncbi:CorA family divalent cation transporter [Enterococcus dongliensis]|uniref:CorA family divalent cation transporter n=1 Tax=Enterococcus dongliensis TaxID=2559925 RepID=UPI00289AB9EB|nr:CorA family divalent cation transporter [Enterococcus dongliensis]